MQDTSTLAPLAIDPNNTVNNTIEDGSLSLMFTVDGQSYVIDPVCPDTKRAQGLCYEALFKHPQGARLFPYYFRIKNDHDQCVLINKMTPREVDYLQRKLRSIGFHSQTGVLQRELKYHGQLDILAETTQAQLYDLFGPYNDILLNLGNAGQMPIKRPFTDDTAKFHFTLPRRIFKLQYVEMCSGGNIDNHVRVSYGKLSSKANYCRLLDEENNVVDLAKLGSYDFEVIAPMIWPAIHRVFGEQGKIDEIHFLIGEYRIHRWTVPE